MEPTLFAMLACFLYATQNVIIEKKIRADYIANG